MGCISKKNMAAPEQGPITLPGKKKCFACKETSHNLDQCRIKDKLGTVARLFGRSTSFPFYMIQPSKEVVKNEKLYHHCLLITSNTCNLDPARVKTELNKFWELTDDWDIRREGRQNFVASFNSEDDLLSCLKPPNVETFLDEKEVNFSVAMWDGGDGEKLDLIKEWLLVYGVPDAYRNWKELYQVASAVGVLLEVDEESLESGDKEPIRLRIALGSLVGAPFSYHFVFGWSSRLVEFMIEDKVRRIEGQWKEVEERNVSVMKEYADAREEEDIPKAEGGQSICGSMDKPAIKNVYTRRNRKQKESTEGSTLFAHINSDSTCEGIQKPPIKNAYEGSDPKQKGYTGGQVASMELNKAMNPGSSSHADCTRNKTEAKTLGAEGAQSIKGSSACMIRVTRSKGVDEAGTTLQGDRLTQFYEEFNTYNEIYDSFVEMGLRENLLKGIYAYGLEKPSAVHQRGIVPLCKGLDVIQQSLSGTTVTLACGVLQRLNYGSTECQALILVPTRDLAQETEKVIGALGQWLGVKAHACLGGTSIRGDKQSLSNSTQVIVATPSRALDMLRGQALCPDNIRMFVLDQADETLAGGLKNQIYDIIQLLPAKIQFAVFSTVMSHEALELCRKCMNKPMKVIVPKDEELESFSIKQFYVKAEEEELKFEKLCDLFDTMAVKQNIIFVDARQKVKSLTEKIRGRGYTVSASHGGMNQHERDVAVQDLRSGSSLVLVTTDLRGADTLQVPVVINYDLPTQAIQYIRHVRRSGQPGGNGVAISFIAPADRRVLSDIQRFCNAQMEELPSNVADLL
ncbi:hypothetical protein ZWY2020_003551 [Hordeum vulgare]|nr:hypothetical protein ZWY2020_003551 [Hordeum vulgare]